MNFDEMKDAVSDAKRTIRLADMYVDTMATLITGKLRSGKVGYIALEALKRELKDYNIQTLSWKEKK